MDLIHYIDVILTNNTAQLFAGFGGGRNGRAIIQVILLRFHNHAPQRRSIRLAFHQQAADDLGGNLLGGAGKTVLGEAHVKRSGYGGGIGTTY